MLKYLNLHITLNEAFMNGYHARLTSPVRLISSGSLYSQHKEKAALRHPIEYIFFHQLQRRDTILTKTEASLCENPLYIQAFLV